MYKHIQQSSLFCFCSNAWFMYYNSRGSDKTAYRPMSTVEKYLFRQKCKNWIVWEGVVWHVVDKAALQSQMKGYPWLNRICVPVASLMLPWLVGLQNVSWKKEITSSPSSSSVAIWSNISSITYMILSAACGMSIYVCSFLKKNGLKPVRQRLAYIIARVRGIDI